MNDQTFRFERKDVSERKLFSRQLQFQDDLSFYSLRPHDCVVQLHRTFAPLLSEGNLRKRRLSLSILPVAFEHLATSNIRLMMCSFVVLESLGWLVLDEWELRWLLLHAESPIELVPLGAQLALSILLLLLFLLSCNGQLLELLAIDFHVGADHLVGNRRDGLVPMLLLRAV